VTDVFISYVHEDRKVVGYLKQILEMNDISVWLDKEMLQPGVMWKTAIENAIRGGIYFLSVHSKARQARERSYANEELVVAIDEFRMRPPSKMWLIPIVIDDCSVDDRPLGGGMKYSDIQRCDLAKWSVGLRKLLAALGIENPICDPGEPISRGMPSFIKIQGGHVHYDFIEGAPSHLQGMEHRVVGGWCQKQDEAIIAYFELKAPLKAIEEFNKLLGYTGFYAFCSDDLISEDASDPSCFVYERELVAPMGSSVPNFMTGENVILPLDMPFVSRFEARGVINSNGTFSGDFSAEVSFALGSERQSSRSGGIFEIQFGPDALYPWPK
jgi:hypothetical protein